MKWSRPEGMLLSTFLMVMLTLWGCGGGEEPEQPAAAPPPAAAQAAVQIAKPKPKKKQVVSPLKATKTKATIDPNSMDVNQPNFQKIDQKVAISDNQLFEFSTPQTIDVANQFTIAQIPNSTNSARNSTPSLPEDFVELPEFGFAENGYANRIRCTIDDSEMVYIPGGVCVVGIDEKGAANGPQFSCYVSPYYIDVSEVTLRQYQQHRAKLKEGKKRIIAPPLNADMPDDHPALGLHWGEARAYVRAIGKDLPTEVEWEKAARGTDGKIRPWGKGRAVWTNPRTTQTVSAVLSYPNDESSFGVFDLAGNAREWCYDYYSEDSYDQALQSSNDVPRDWKGPKVASPRNHRVVKGNGPDWNVWYRGHQHQSEHDPTIGFRGILRIEVKEEDEADEKRVTRR